ncbi:MAG: hypothetical protein KDK33_09795 [Leptospiraceae bacterium]|nr:hypothetical protein [Leptospiraceae bacterium]
MLSFANRYESLAWREYIRGSIIRSRLANSAGDVSKVVPIPAEYLVLDATIRPHLNDGYNWWWTWPAVYPFTGFWPVQRRIADYTITVEYKIMDPHQQVIKNGTVSVQDRSELIIFGFYRTLPLEQMIYRSNLEVVRNWMDALRDDLSRLPACAVHKSDENPSAGRK